MFKHLDDCCVQRSKSLRDALEALERGGAKIVLVVDDAKRLAGTLTDGDIRRALLAGTALDATVESFIQTNFTSVSPATGRAEVLDLMRARTISQIPVLDGAGKLVGLHLLQELVGGEPRENWAVVMAGGKGTRLRPLTEETPKPMLKVAGRPILERIILHLVGFGIRRIFLSINYLGEVIEGHFKDGAAFGCRIEYLREDRPLGTGGSLSLLPAPSRPIVVMNGDLITQADIGAMFEFHERQAFKATVGVRRYFHTIPFGCVDVDGHRIVSMEEKPRLARLVNAGIYVLEPELVTRVPKQQEFSLPSLLETALEKKEPVGAFEIEDDWIDVGQREQLRQAREGS